MVTVKRSACAFVIAILIILSATFVVLSSIRVPPTPPSWTTLRPTLSWRALSPTIMKEQPIRLVFVGDIMLDRNVARRMQLSGDPMYSFRKLPEHWFDSFDYAIANLEGPVTDRHRPPEKSIDFLFATSVIPVLQATGIDAFSQANNHALDQGEIGWRDSRTRLQQAGFLVFGHEVRDDEIALATTTVKGVRLAFLGFNTTDNPLDEKAAHRVIQEATSWANHTIVFMHWGTEYHDHPDPGTVAQAHWLIDQGVDIVIGGHPHWVQGIEWYRGKPIAYSLGNFIFDQDFSPETRRGLALGVNIWHDRLELQPMPVQIDQSQPHL